jgi:hypothetical protein
VKICRFARAGDRQLEIGLRIQNSQLPQLNQFLQGQIFEAVFDRAIDELRRYILHFGADDLVDADLESRRLQRFDVLRGNVLHFHGNEFRHRRIQAERANRAHVLRRHVLHPHGNGVVGARVDSLIVHRL